MMYTNGSKDSLDSCSCCLPRLNYYVVIQEELLKFMFLFQVGALQTFLCTLISQQQQQNVLESIRVYNLKPM